MTKKLHSITGTIAANRIKVGMRIMVPAHYGTMIIPVIITSIDPDKWSDALIMYYTDANTGHRDYFFTDTDRRYRRA